VAPGTYNGLITITAAGSASSPKTVSVVLTVKPAPILTVTPAALSFSYRMTDPAPAAQTLTISGVATTYSATASGETWLSVTPASGGTSGTANVSIDPAGLTAGSYSGTVTVIATGSTNSPLTIPVSLTVTPPPPTLQVSPASLSFTCAVGNIAPVPFVLQLSSSSTPLNYTIAPVGGSWLSVSATSGSTSGMVFVSVNPAGLSAGTYNASLNVASSNSRGNTSVPVMLTVSNTATCTAVPAQ
jgi:hypothetical protein